MRLHLAVQVDDFGATRALRQVVNVLGVMRHSKALLKPSQRLMRSIGSRIPQLRCPFGIPRPNTAWRR